MSANAQSSLDLPKLPGIEAGWEIITIETDRKSGRFTAEQLAKNEEKRDAVVRAIAEGMGVRAIARAFGISTNTVAALRAATPAGEIETQKQQAGARFGLLRDLAVERMIEEIDQMPRASLPIVAGVATDKGELLRGAPTARVQHDVSLSPTSVAEYIASLPAAQPVISGESAGQKARGIDAAVEALAASVPGGVQGGALDVGDSQSPVSAQVPERDGALGADGGQIDAQKGGAS